MYCVQVPRRSPDSLVLRRAIFRHQQPSEVISCSYWSIKSWFHTEGNCCYTASYLPLGVSQRTCDPRNQAFFLAPLPGSKRISARGVSRFQSLYFVIVLLSLFLFSLVCFIYQKHKKISYFYFQVVIFLFCFNFAKMSTPGSSFSLALIVPINPH